MADNTQITQLPRRRNNGAPAPASNVIAPTTSLAAAPDAVAEAEAAATMPPQAQEEYVAPAIESSSELDGEMGAKTDTEMPDVLPEKQPVAAVRQRLVARVAAKAKAKEQPVVRTRKRSAKAAVKTAPARAKKSGRKGPTPALDKAGIKELAAMAKAGKSVKQAAKALKVSVMTASRYAKLNGVTFIDGRKLRFMKKTKTTSAATKSAAKAAPVRAAAKAPKRKYTKRAGSAAVAARTIDVKALARAFVKELGLALKAV